MEFSVGARGPGWAFVLGCLALVLAGVLAADSADYVGRAGASAVGYVAVALGVPLLAVLTFRTFALWIAERPIWPVEWAWLVLLAGVLALGVAGMVAADHANDAQEGLGPALAPGSPV